jgi:hypothetical protein
MSTLKQVRQALTDIISVRCGIDTRPYMPDTVTPPMVSFVPGSPPVSFGGTLNEAAEIIGDPNAPSSPTGYRLQALVIVSRAITEDAQMLVEELVDSGSERAGVLLSIPDAIMSDDTLGHVVEWCVPTEVSQIGQLQIAGQDYFHARILLSISA